MRQLTYNIPLAPMSRTNLIQDMIAKEAVSVNGKCLISYESLHTYRHTISNMVIKLVVTEDQCDYIHRTMQNAIAVAIKAYCISTSTIHVTDTPVMTRDFNCEDIS